MIEHTSIFSYLDKNLLFYHVPMDILVIKGMVSKEYQVYDHFKTV